MSCVPSTELEFSVADAKQTLVESLELQSVRDVQTLW